MIPVHPLPPHSVTATPMKSALVLILLRVAIGATAELLPVTGSISEPQFLLTRIIAGLVLSAQAMVHIVLLLPSSKIAPLGAAGTTSFRSGWTLAVWRALLWFVPAELGCCRPFPVPDDGLGLWLFASHYRLGVNVRWCSYSLTNWCAAGPPPGRK